jgi:hypothetical protein
MSIIFSINSYKKDNYDNVTRLSCKSDDKLTLTIDVHNILFDKLNENTKSSFSVEFVSDDDNSLNDSLNDSFEDADYIMNCIVIHSSIKKMFLSCHGLLFCLENNNTNIELPLLKPDDSLNVLINCL